MPSSSCFPCCILDCVLGPGSPPHCHPIHRDLIHLLSFPRTAFLSPLRLFFPSSSPLSPSCLSSPSSFLLPPFLLPPSSFLLPPSSFLLPPSSFLLPPSSFLLLPSSCSLLHRLLLLTFNFSGNSAPSASSASPHDSVKHSSPRVHSQRSQSQQVLLNLWSWTVYGLLRRLILSPLLLNELRDFTNLFNHCDAGTSMVSSTPHSCRCSRGADWITSAISTMICATGTFRNLLRDAFRDQDSLRGDPLGHLVDFFSCAYKKCTSTFSSCVSGTDTSATSSTVR